MPVVNNAVDAGVIVRQKLIELNGPLGVVMFQIGSVNLINYPKNNSKPTWRVSCSYYSNLAGTQRVSKEVYVDQATGEVVDLNGTDHA